MNSGATQSEELTTSKAWLRQYGNANYKEDCQAKCDAQPNCAGVSFYGSGTGDTCWLFDSTEIGKPVVDQGGWDIRVSCIKQG